MSVRATRTARHAPLLATWPAPAHLVGALTRRRTWRCAAAATLGLGMVGCGTNGGDGGQAKTTTSSKGGRTVAAAAESPGTAKSGRCTSMRAPAPKGVQRIRKPTISLDPSKNYVVSLTTNCGRIDIRLDVRQAPRTTASFAYLVKRGFYDDLTFHRVAAGFVIQGGDPNGDGSGGPGYTVVEPPPSDIRYTRGTVAMAKTEGDPSGASGSQFFIVTARDASLPPRYALVGNVVDGFAGVQTIARLHTDPPQDGTPTTPVVITRATLHSTS